MITTNISIKELWKQNLIKLAKHHRESCKGGECDISLYLLLHMAEKLKIKFTDKEKELFI